MFLEIMEYSGKLFHKFAVISVVLRSEIIAIKHIHFFLFAHNR